MHNLKKYGGINTIRWRMMLGFVAITLIGFGIVLLLTTQIIRNYLVGQRLREMQNAVNIMTNSISYDYSQQNSDELYTAAVKYAGQYSGHMIVLDENGVVQVDSSSTWNGRRITNEAVADVLWGGQKTREMKQQFDVNIANEPSTGAFKSWWQERFPPKTTTVYYVQAIQDQEQTVGAVLFSAQIQDVLDRVGSLTNQITLVMVITIGALIILSAILANSLTRPIAELTTVIRRMGRGELTQRVKLSGSKELADLGKTFNDMSEQLEQTDRVRSEFVSSASHEIKTPLATMKILVETLLYQDPLDEGMAREFLGDIDKEINRLNAVITDLLRLVQADKTGEELTANFKTIDLKDICEDAVKRLYPIAQKRNIALSADLHAAKMKGDAIKLDQALFNLIDNAIKYTNEGGRVFVSCVTEGKNCVFSVTDTGIGIPEQDISKVFERFYRVDKARARTTGGTGLGLAIVERMVKLHQGEISVESEENVGTTFTVIFPGIKE